MHNNPYAPAPVPVSTACKCRNASSGLAAVMDAARGGADVRAGRAVDALLGQAVYYYRCGFTFTRAFDHWTPADFALRIYNRDYGRHDPAHVPAWLAPALPDTG